MSKGLKVILGILVCVAIVWSGFAVANAIHEGGLNEYIDSFEKVKIENQLLPAVGEDGNYYFTTDGDFKVLHLTDIHIGGGIFSAETDKKAINAVAAMITAEKPDMVVVTGDISFAVPWGGTINNGYAHRYFIRLMENLGVYWTVTFGNHDSEGYDYYSRSAVARMYEDEALEYCLFSSGPEDIFGECNHVINVRNSAGLVTKSLIMMDTNAYEWWDPIGILWDYDNIHEDQIEWYKATIKGLNEYNKSVLDTLEEKPENIENYTTVQSIFFAHIPLMEVRDAYNEYAEAGEKDTDNVKYIGGKIGESAPYVYASEKPEEMFETILDLGSTKAMFYGHDHLNNIVLNYKGVILSYGYSIDYFAYSDIDLVGSQRGCAVINCHSDTTFDIIHENYYQDKYQPVYEKEIVDLTN